MSSSNQNTILAHRSVYGDSQSDSSSTEYKTVSFKKKAIPTPRRITNRKISNNSTLAHFNEKSQLRLQIANLKDEIAQLNQELDKKMKNFSSSELASIFILNHKSKPIELTHEKYKESATLDKNIEDLAGIFDSESINRLSRSNQNQKIILNSVQEDLENTNMEIQEIRKKINKIQNSDIFQSIFDQRKKISEKHKQIHDAVEIHRKLKEELRQLEDYDSTRIKELEKTLLEAQENKKGITKKYQALRKQQQKEKIEAEAEKYRRSQKFTISSIYQSFELCKDKSDLPDQEDCMKKSIVTFEQIQSETGNEKGINIILSSTLNSSKNYIQENDIQMNSDFEIAAQLLSENEEEDIQSDKQMFEKENNEILYEDNEGEKVEKDEESNKRKVEFVNNSIQCELKDDELEKQIDSNQNSQIAKEPNKQKRNELPSSLFPPESEIESTSIVYSENDFSSSQIEIMKKERKEQSIFQLNPNLDQSNIELHLNEKLEFLSSCNSASDGAIEKEDNVDFQSESTSIYNSTIDSISLSEKNEQSSISESTSILTSSGYFRLNKVHKQFSRQENAPNKIMREKIINDDQKYAKYNEENDNNVIPTEESESMVSGELVILETSKPIAFESPENSDQSQLTTGGDQTEYNDYLSSQQLEKDDSESIIESDKNHSSSDFEKKLSNKQNLHPVKHEANIIIDSVIEKLENSIDSSRKKNINKSTITATNDDSDSPSLAGKPKFHNNNNCIFNCLPAALMSASDDYDYGSNICNDKKIGEKETRKRSSSTLSSRRQKKYSDRSDVYASGNNNDDEDVLDNMFIAQDDRKILKVGCFSKKPSKKEIMPYFVRFGTVSSFLTQKENSKYYTFIAFKKHSSAKNAKKNLNGSKIAGTRLNISWESDSSIHQNFLKTDSNLKSNQNIQNSELNPIPRYEAIINTASSSSEL